MTRDRQFPPSLRNPFAALTAVLVATATIGTGTAQARPFDALAKTEPFIRVGVVLPQDSIRHLVFVLPPGAEYRISGGAEETTFRADLPTSGDARMIGDQIEITLATVPTPRVFKGDTLKVSPVAPQKLEKGAGILLKGLVAGRGFHWQKPLDQTLLGSIQFHPWKTGALIVVNELPVEQYMAGVLTGEMSGECPLEFMKAQTVAARSWYFAGGEMGKHTPLPFSRCNDDCCQRYQGTGDLSPRAIQTIEETRGEVMVSKNGTVVDANYSKSCGGILADPAVIWGGPKPAQHTGPDAPKNSSVARFFPVTDANVREYLTGDWLATTDVFCGPNAVPEKDLPKYLGRVDVAQHYFRWTVRYSQTELEEILARKVPLPDLKTLTGLRLGNRESSGRLSDLTVNYISTTGKASRHRINGQYNIRNALHPSFLYSSAFVLDTKPGADDTPSEYIFRGGGWGHGAGLCQIGALGMALKGYPYNEIVEHYFHGIALRKAYP